MTRAEAVEFLGAGTRTGKLATVRPDGRPHVVPVWFVVEGDEVVFTTWHETVKCRNLRRDGRAALTVDLEEPPYAFVTVEGDIQISDDPDELVEAATRIAARYMGPDRAEEFGRRNGVEGELVVRLGMDEIIARHDISA
jgi:PPOX class probable F420-dependent enzyme